MLITGTARGIGAAVALAAAPTHDLVVNYVASVDAAAEHGGRGRRANWGQRVLVQHADVGVEADVLAMFAAIDEQFGRLDVLVNNAGVAGGYGTTRSFTADGLANCGP